MLTLLDFESKKKVFILFIERQKKSAQKVWSKDLVHKTTFRLSSRTPHLI